MRRQDTVERPGPSRTTGCSATPVPPHWSPPTAPSTGCASPASTANPCSAAWSAGRRRHLPHGASRTGHGHRPPLPPPHRHPGNNLGHAGGQLTLTEGMIAEVRGRLLPSTLLVRRLTADGGPVDGSIELRSPPRRSTTAAAHRAPRRRRRVQLVGTAIALRASPPRPPSSRTAGDAARRRPVGPLTVALGVADREPLIYVDPDGGLGGTRGRRTRLAGLVCRHRRRPPAPRRGGPQPAHPAAADLLAVGRAGRGTDDLAPGRPRRDPQLGLPLRLAPRRQHRHRRLPRRRQDTTKPATSSPGCSTPAAWTDLASLSCSPSTAATRPRNASSTAGPATPTAARSASATAPTTSTSSTATAGSSTPPGCSPTPAIASTPRPGGPCAASPTRSRNGGANPTPGSGRSAAMAPTTCTPSSWPGSPSTAPCGSPPPTAPRPPSVARWRAERDAIAADVTAPASTPSAAPTRAATVRTTSTPPCSSSRSWTSNRPTRLGSAATIEAIAASSAPAAHCCTATRPARTACPAPKAPSCPVRSGSSKPSPAPAAATKRPSCSPTSSTSPTRSASTPRRWTRQTPQHLGNYPQALTHAALVQAALAIRDT